MVEFLLHAVMRTKEATKCKHYSFTHLMSNDFLNKLLCLHVLFFFNFLMMQLKDFVITFPSHEPQSSACFCSGYAPPGLPGCFTGVHRRLVT